MVTMTVIISGTNCYQVAHTCGEFSTHFWVRSALLVPFPIGEHPKSSEVISTTIQNSGCQDGISCTTTLKVTVASLIQSLTHVLHLGLNQNADSQAVCLI